MGVQGADGLRSTAGAGGTLRGVEGNGWSARSTCTHVRIVSDPCSGGRWGLSWPHWYVQPPPPQGVKQAPGSELVQSRASPCSLPRVLWSEWVPVTSVPPLCPLVWASMTTVASELAFLLTPTPLLSSEVI